MLRNALSEALEQKNMLRIQELLTTHFPEEGI
jgi:hypothetical protein